MAQETPPPLARRGAIPRLALAPLALIAIVALAYLASRPLGEGEAQPSFFVIGSAVPGVQVGQVAPGSAQAGSPKLALTAVDGKPISLVDFEGRPIWVIFWKTACDPCEAEAADVAAAYATHRGDHLAVIGIDVWDSAAVVQDYDREHGLEIPVAIPSDFTAMDAYGVWGAPTHYFIDREGIIRDRYFGPMTRELIEKSLRRII